jgi:hypothetical protein
MLTIRLNAKDQALLTRLAEEKSVPISTYARSLLTEALKQEEDPGRQARQMLDAIEQDNTLKARLRRIALFLDERR